MPAVARKVTPESHQSYQSASAPGADAAVRTRGGAPASRSRRWQEEATRTAPVKSRRKNTPSQQPVQTQEDWRGLVDHFNGQQAERVEGERLDIDARRLARRRERLRHRPFRLTFLTIALLGAPLLLLACLLSMNSNALALARADVDLQRKIESTRFDLENTRKEIAALNSSPLVEHWARSRGWQQAKPQDFDDVSRIVPVTSNLVESSREAP